MRSTSSPANRVVCPLEHLDQQLEFATIKPQLSSPNPLNLITLHLWEIELWNGMPHSLIVGFHQPGKGPWMLGAYGLVDAIRQVADLAGLDAEFRDAQGEEWDILIPDTALAYEFPDGHIDDSYVERRRQAQLSGARQLSEALHECDDPNCRWTWKGDHGVLTVNLPPRCANLPWERKAIIFERWRARYYPRFDKHWELKREHAVFTVRLPVRLPTLPTNQPW